MLGVCRDGLSPPVDCGHGTVHGCTCKCEPGWTSCAGPSLTFSCEGLGVVCDVPLEYTDNQARSSDTPPSCSNGGAAFPCSEEVRLPPRAPPHARPGVVRAESPSSLGRKPAVSLSPGPLAAPRRIERGKQPLPPTPCLGT